MERSKLRREQIKHNTIDCVQLLQF